MTTLKEVADCQIACVADVEARHDAGSLSLACIEHARVQAHGWLRQLDQEAARLSEPQTVQVAP
jgi:hypothetical protein